MEARNMWDDIPKCWKKKIYSQQFYIQHSYTSKGKGKLGYSRINKNREFIAIKPALPQILKGALQTEMKEHWRVIQIHMKKYRRMVKETILVILKFTVSACFVIFLSYHLKGNCTKQ